MSDTPKAICGNGVHFTDGGQTQCACKLESPAPRPPHPRPVVLTINNAHTLHSWVKWLLDNERRFFPFPLSAPDNLKLALKELEEKLAASAPKDWKPKQ